MNRFYTRLALSVVALLLVVLTGCAANQPSSGTSTSPSEASRPQEIELIAKDITFSPNTLTVQVGQPVTVQFRNQGVLEHDFTVVELAAADISSATEGESDAHQDEMAHGNEAENQIHVAALGGKEGAVTFTPQKPGTYEFYCTVAGHKEAGMVGTLTVQ